MTLNLLTEVISNLCRGEPKDLWFEHVYINAKEDFKHNSIQNMKRTVSHCIYCICSRYSEMPLKSS
jgi:hypothetical protein